MRAPSPVIERAGPGAEKTFYIKPEDTEWAVEEFHVWALANATDLFYGRVLSLSSPSAPSAKPVAPWLGVLTTQFGSTGPISRDEEFAQRLELLFEKLDLESRNAPQLSLQDRYTQIEDAWKEALSEEEPEELEEQTDGYTSLSISCGRGKHQLALRRVTKMKDLVDAMGEDLELSPENNLKSEIQGAPGDGEYDFEV